MQVLSLNVALPTQQRFGDKIMRTAILKLPVDGRRMCRTLGIEGDGQGDQRVHGGPTKAVYLYPSEHALFWCARLGLEQLPHGSLGENLSSVGLSEDAVRIGDRLRVGTAELVVSEPRFPCGTLAARFGRPDMIELMNSSGRHGFYLSVAVEGELGAGDAIELLESDPQSLTVAEVLAAKRTAEPSLLARAVALKHLPEALRKRLAALLKG